MIDMSRTGKNIYILYDFCTLFVKAFYFFYFILRVVFIQFHQDNTKSVFGP